MSLTSIPHKAAKSIMSRVQSSIVACDTTFGITQYPLIDSSLKYVPYLACDARLVHIASSSVDDGRIIRGNDFGCRLFFFFFFFLTSRFFFTAFFLTTAFAVVHDVGFGGGLTPQSVNKCFVPTLEVGDDNDDDNDDDDDVDVG